MSMRSAHSGVVAPSAAHAYLPTMVRAASIPALPGKRFNVGDHRLQLLHDPDDRLQAVLMLIDAATQSLSLSIYMFHADTSGTEVRNALVRAAERGVAVELLIDSFGCSDVPDSFFRPVAKAGGRYCYFSSRWRLSYLIRNHQKLLVIDDKHALVGGFNITDQYFGRRGDQSWEDLGIVLSGPEAARIAAYARELFELSEDGGVRLSDLRRLILRWKPGSGQLRWLVGGPTTHLSPWGLALKRDLQTAQSINIAAAYFSPTQSILRRIARVGRSGKVARLILAGRTDNGATIGAARILYGYLLKRDVRIAEYQPRLLHTKLLVIDNACYIGSANLDVRSLFINKEIMLRIEDAKLAQYLRGLIDTMEAESEVQTADSHSARINWISRLRWSLAYLLVNSVDYNIGRRIKLRLAEQLKQRRLKS